MDGVRQYVISVMTAALICSIVMAVAQKGTGRELVRLLCGLFLALTVLRPIARLELDALTQLPVIQYSEAESVSAAGKKMAEDAMKDIIKAQTEAYILDKASLLNTQIGVEVTVSDTCLPMEAKLSGEISPYTRQQLENILESDLGITKENQIWSG